MKMDHDSPLGRFCWLDLAATDAECARAFYHDLFGWSARTRTVAHGRFDAFVLGADPVASVYQLNRRHLADGVPSHWTPYVAVRDVDQASRRVAAVGGAVIVKPFDTAGLARIALVQDPVGALLGLWQHTPDTDSE